MKNTPLCLALSLAFVAGCTTPSQAPVKPEAKLESKTEKPVAVVPARNEAAETLMQKVSQVPEPVKVEDVTPQAKMVTEMLEQGMGATEYTKTDTTGFPESLLSLQPGRPKPKFEVPANYSGVPTRGLTADGFTVDLVERDWTGIILTPMLTQVAKAYVAGIQLSNIEVHPLSDGRVRIWVRVRNQMGAGVPTEIACSFKRSAQAETSTMFYRLEIPAKGSRDVFFVSPGGEAINYTVLVRRAVKS